MNFSTTGTLVFLDFEATGCLSQPKSQALMYDHLSSISLRAVQRNCASIFELKVFKVHSASCWTSSNDQSSESSQQVPFVMPTTEWFLFWAYGPRGSVELRSKVVSNSSAGK